MDVDSTMFSASCRNLRIEKTKINTSAVLFFTFLSVVNAENVNVIMHLWWALLHF